MNYLSQLLGEGTQINVIFSMFIIFTDLKQSRFIYFPFSLINTTLILFSLCFFLTQYYSLLFSK